MRLPRREPDRLVRLLGNNARDILRYLERRVGADEAADALSEAMSAAWRRRSSASDNDDEARLWMFGIARNVVLNVARGQQRRSKLADRMRGTVRIIQTQEVVADDVLDVRAALDSLDPDLAELIRLVHWEASTSRMLLT